MARIALITTHAAAGPSVQASSAPPTRCPLAPMPTGKLIICAAKTNAPITPNRGTLASSNPRCARRTTQPTAGAAAESSVAHTGVERNPSGICTVAFKVARTDYSCHRGGDGNSEIVDSTRRRGDAEENAEKTKKAKAESAEGAGDEMSELRSDWQPAPPRIGGFAGVTMLYA